MLLPLTNTLVPPPQPLLQTTQVSQTQSHNPFAYYDFSYFFPCHSWTPHSPHPFLPAIYLTPHPSFLSFHPNLLTICGRSSSQARPFQRHVFSCSSYTSLSSLGRTWLRPRALKFFADRLSHIELEQSKNELGLCLQTLSETRRTHTISQ